MNIADIVRQMSDVELLGVWDRLEYYDQNDYYDTLNGITMDDWVNTIVSELRRRDLLSSRYRQPAIEEEMEEEDKAVELHNLEEDLSLWRESTASGLKRYFQPRRSFRKT